MRLRKIASFLTALATYGLLAWVIVGVVRQRQGGWDSTLLRDFFESPARRADMNDLLPPPGVKEELHETGPTHLARLAEAMSTPLPQEHTGDWNWLVRSLNQAMADDNLTAAIRLVEYGRLQWPESEELKKTAGNLYGALGNEAFTARNFPEALPLFERAFELNPGNASVAVGLGFTEFHLGYPHQAEGRFKAALDLDPKESQAWYGLGEVAYARNQTSQALESWETAARLQPGNADLREKIERARKELDAEARFSKTESAHFIISFDPGDHSNLAGQVKEVLETAYREVGQALEHFPTAKIPVLIYREDQFREVTGTHDWVGGLYDGKIRVVSAPRRRISRDLERHLRHEYTHAVIYSVSGSRCPTWLNEGLAQLMEGKRTSRASTPLFYSVLKANALVPLKHLEGPFMEIPTNEAAQLAYDQSLAVSEYLWKRYGRAAVHRILEGLGAGQSFDAAFRATAAKDGTQLLNEASRHYRGE